MNKRFSRRDSCSGAEVLCERGFQVRWVRALLGVAARSHAALWNGISISISSQLRGEMSHLRRRSRGLSSRGLIKSSCDRSDGDERVQVLRVCFQGNADENSGRSPQYIASVHSVLKG